MRTRLSIRQQGTLLKCRIQAALRRYGVRDYSDRADLFSTKSRAKLATCMGRLPQETRIATLHEWELLDFLEAQIGALEERIRERIATIGWVRLLKTLPGVGTILGGDHLPLLKWAFVEAANVVATRQKQWAGRHAVQLYQRLKASKCHGKAATAVARHLAESSWWILSKKQPYREPAPATMSSSKNG